MSTSSAALPARQTQNGVLLQWANTIAVIVTIVFNILSQALPIGVDTNAVLANQYNPYNYFLPANYVFAIWGVIYLGMIAFAWWQSRPEQRSNPRFHAVGWWFIIGSLGNIGWLILFQNLQFSASMIPLVTLLVTLGIIYVRIRQIQRPAPTLERVGLFAFISLYFAWSAVATVANGAFILLSLQFGVTNVNIAAAITPDLISQYQIWGAIMLVIAGLIATAVAFTNGDLIYAGVIVWAFVGIIVRHSDIAAVVIPAAIMAVLALTGAIVGMVRLRSGAHTA